MRSNGLRMAAATVCLLGWVNNVGAARHPALLVGQPAPDFQVTTYDGAKLTLADFRGQVLLLNFWATWCGPCRRELPLLSAYHEASKGRGLQMLAVATEDSVPPDQLRSLAKAVSFPMVRRFKGNYPEIKELPTNFVIDKEGIVRYAEAGGFTLEGLNAVLIPLLRERQAASAENIE